MNLFFELFNYTFPFNNLILKLFQFLITATRIFKFCLQCFVLFVFFWQTLLKSFKSVLKKLHLHRLVVFSILMLTFESGFKKDYFVSELGNCLSFFLHFCQLFHSFIKSLFLVFILFLLNFHFFFKFAWRISELNHFLWNFIKFPLILFGSLQCLILFFFHWLNLLKNILNFLLQYLIFLLLLFNILLVLRLSLVSIIFVTFLGRIKFKFQISIFLQKFVNLSLHLKISLVFLQHLVFLWSFYSVNLHPQFFLFIRQLFNLIILRFNHLMIKVQLLLLIAVLLL